MTDTILKQNAGRGGAVLVVGTTKQIPAGQYDRVEFLAVTTFPVLPTQTERPLLTSDGWLTTTQFPANSSIKTPFVIGAGSLTRMTGTAIFYKAI
jgi:hypothetical protein